LASAGIGVLPHLSFGESGKTLTWILFENIWESSFDNLRSSVYVPCARGGILVRRSIPALVGLVLATPGIAQESSNIIVFLKSPYYSEVEQLVRGTGEKTIDSSWCRPGANLAPFPWTDEFKTVGRGNNPLPIVHAIMIDPNGKCEYFVVYASSYAVPPDLAKRLATWTPALLPARQGPNSVALEMPQTQTAVVLPPPAADQIGQSKQQVVIEEETIPLPRPRPQIAAVKRNPVPPKPTALAPPPPSRPIGFR
jgi:hypothetical protein